MLKNLPLELVLSIFRYCDARTLYNAQLVSRGWATAIAENENTVYRATAIYHGFVDPSSTLEELSTDWTGLTSSEHEHFRGWKDFCRRRFQVEYNWEGRGSTPKTTLFRSTGKDVHRFKIDERRDAQFIITTHRRGGLKVTCMDTDTVLFELRRSYVRQYAHCEYDNGFLIFDRFHPHALEMWRLSNDNDWDGSVPESNVLHRPDISQLTTPRKHSDASAGRGSFKPWALFEPRNSPRAYRFVYPHLLVGSEWGQELYIFNVLTTTLDETIPIPLEAIPDGETGVHINYVELGARHAFVCTPYGVLILPRFQHMTGDTNGHNGDEAPQFIDFPSSDPDMHIPQLIRHYATRMIQTFGPPSNPAMREFILTAPRVPEQSTALVRIGEDRQEFSAVHVSADGKNFIAITVFGVGYFVRDFERVFRGEASISDVALRINLGTSALNLAFDHDRAIIQTIHGVFVFNLHTTAPYEVITPRYHESSLSPQPPVLPHLSAHQLLHFRNPLPLRLVTCVKLSRTCVWLDWSARALEEVEGRAAPLPDEEDGFWANGDDEVREEHPYGMSTPYFPTP
ncbi:uncharacterized protein FOMMEDRAFT_150476 [Fomitiporia mediterranea MF3/22]|uniref:uncharacterized protein n=1 Tax=Fomitiporia mediterranea (strain MF3/22) TaxID=694068 RepID=UPI00044072B6|nr:uncharacterized protein FOMMEDRAFT_150476 [Fomitiporia mediterranea MF3/22]EJD07887.1 hypothetical protein FOMMEDRAFT_150476 [Fomitiporia mediterranea MF3/22]